MYLSIHVYASPAGSPSGDYKARIMVVDMDIPNPNGDSYSKVIDHHIVVPTGFADREGTAQPLDVIHFLETLAAGMRREHMVNTVRKLKQRQDETGVQRM